MVNIWGSGINNHPNFTPAEKSSKRVELKRPIVDFLLVGTKYFRDLLKFRKPIGTETAKS